jgi:hypothetical protein
MTCPPPPPNSADPNGQRAAEVASAIERIRAGAAGPLKRRVAGAVDRVDDSVSRAAAVIEQRRRLLVHPPRNIAIGDLIAGIRRESERTSRRFGALVELWEKMLPEAIVNETRLASLRGGVLVVIVASASVGYELDRLLREGAMAEMRGRYAGTLVRVSVRVGNVDGADA